MTDTRTDAEKLEALEKRAVRLDKRIDRLHEDAFDLRSDIAAIKLKPKMPG